MGLFGKKKSQLKGPGLMILPGDSSNDVGDIKTFVLEKTVAACSERGWTVGDLLKDESGVSQSELQVAIGSSGADIHLHARHVAGAAGPLFVSVKLRGAGLSAAETDERRAALAQVQSEVQSRFPGLSVHPTAF